MSGGDKCENLYWDNLASFTLNKKQQVFFAFLHLLIWRESQMLKIFITSVIFCCCCKTTQSTPFSMLIEPMEPFSWLRLEGRLNDYGFLLKVIISKLNCILNLNDDLFKTCKLLQRHYFIQQHLKPHVGRN